MHLRDYHFWVYIMASRSRNLYTGMTNDLVSRVSQHRELTQGSFTARYRIDRLVYFEYFQYVRSAITREKEVKRWTRAQRITLIEQGNPTWEDLYPGLLAPRADSQRLDSGGSKQQIPCGDDRKLKGTATRS